MLRSHASNACILCNTTVQQPHRRFICTPPAHLPTTPLITPLRPRPQPRALHIPAVSAEATIPVNADATSIATLPVSWYTLLRITPGASSVHMGAMYTNSTAHHGHTRAIHTGLEQQEYEFALNSLTRRRPTQLRLNSKTLESRDAVLKQAKLNVVDAKSREMYDQLQVGTYGCNSFLHMNTCLLYAMQVIVYFHIACISIL